MRMLSTSRDYIQVPIKVYENGAVVDPTALAVELAFPVIHQAPAAFFVGSWDEYLDTYWAQCLVGPGGTTQLTVGTYDIYVRITDVPEVPIIHGGSVTIY